NSLSASPSFRTTCSGECLRPFMKITSWLPLSHRDPHNGRTTLKGSGHLPAGEDDAVGVGGSAEVGRHSLCAVSVVGLPGAAPGAVPGPIVQLAVLVQAKRGGDHARRIAVICGSTAKPRVPGG